MKKYEGLLEKKWTSVVRLQKKVCRTFSPASHRRHSLSSHELSYKAPPPLTLLLDNGTRIPPELPPIRTRLRYPHLPHPPQCRPFYLAPTSPRATRPNWTSQSSHISRFSPHLFRPCLLLRGLNYQNLGLGAWRTGTND